MRRASSASGQLSRWLPSLSAPKRGSPSTGRPSRFRPQELLGPIVLRFRARRARLRHLERERPPPVGRRRPRRKPDLDRWSVGGRCVPFPVDRRLGLLPPGHAPRPRLAQAFHVEALGAVVEKAEPQDRRCRQHHPKGDEQGLGEQPTTGRCRFHIGSPTDPAERARRKRGAEEARGERISQSGPLQSPQPHTGVSASQHVKTDRKRALARGHRPGGHRCRDAHRRHRPLGTPCLGGGR